MRVLYFDCFSGISGDMTVGALLNLGVPEEYLLKNLETLGISDEYDIKISKGVKNGIEGIDFDVILKEHHQEHEHHHEEDHGHSHGQHCDCGDGSHYHENHDESNEHNHCCDEHEHLHHHEHDHHHDHHHGRNLSDIEKLIDSSGISESAKDIAKRMFMCVAEAEAKVHGKDLYEVHFHEVGAVDSIVDIVSTAICIDYLKPDRVISSHVNTGKGFVKCQHGVIPVPAPATCEILKGVPVYSDEREMELTTPTGAAILKTLAAEFKPLKSARIIKTGYGCGKRNTEKPNLLRVFMCEDDEEVSILEATIDDMNPEIYGYLMDKLFEAGARDVYYTPVYMKKNRPGIVVTVTTPVKLEEKVKEIIFKETTTIGIRRFEIQRDVLERESGVIGTKFGDIRFKASSYKGEIVNCTPEYEDLKSAAIKYNVPLKEVYSEASAAILMNYTK